LKQSKLGPRGIDSNISENCDLTPVSTNISENCDLTPVSNGGKADGGVNC
jgi:hypothetical protein